jgi:serine/threonine-protein kinase
LVHRDVTPHNVLIGVDGAVKLTDFGIARVADADRLSRPGLLMGKLGYFAPEQITGQAIDRRVDLFALGATLYHLAALQKPFDTPMGATLDPTRLPTVPLRVCRPDLPRALIEAIECAMSVSPDSRFATAKAFRNALPVPGPDVADELARLVRRVCPAALFELEAKTERASTLAIETEKTAAPVAQTSVSDAAAVRAAVGSPYRSVAAALVIAALIVGGLLVVRSPPTAEPLAAPPAPAADPPPVEVLDAGPAAIFVNVTPVVDAGSTVLRPASLTVDATPWASLTLDGQPLGDTPRAEVPLTRGAHLLVATCPETGKTVRKSFVAGSGERVVMRLDLR